MRAAVLPVKVPVDLPVRAHPETQHSAEGLRRTAFPLDGGRERTGARRGFFGVLAYRFAQSVSRPSRAHAVGPPADRHAEAMHSDKVTEKHSRPAAARRARYSNPRLATPLPARRHA